VIAIHYLTTVFLIVYLSLSIYLSCDVYIKTRDIDRALDALVSFDDPTIKKHLIKKQVRVFEVIRIVRVILIFLLVFILVVKLIKLIHH